MNRFTYIFHPGSLFVQRQASGFFYYVRRIVVVTSFFVLLHSCVWAQSNELDKALLPAEKDWLKQHREWRLGVDPSWPPVEMIGDDGIYVGIGADYMKLVAQRLGVTLNVLPGLSWAQVIDKAKAGEVDVLPAVAHTFERSAYLNFSDVYINIPLVIITRTDKRNIEHIDDLTGKVVSVAESYPIHEWLLKDYPQILLHPYRNVSYALDAVAFGQADAYIGDVASASYIIDRLKITSLKIVGTTQYTFSDRIGVRKDWPELIPILNKALATISQKEKDEIQSKWIKFKYKLDFWYLMKQVIPFIFGFIVLVLLGVNWILGKEIKIRRIKELALRESEQRLREVQKMTQLGYWKWDVKTGNVEWSEEVFNIFQLDPKEFIPHINSIQALSPWPENHERDKELIRRATERHEKGEYEQRFLRPDKSVGYYYSTFQGHYDAKGDLVSIVGTVMDITDRKRAEESLRMMQFALDNSADTVFQLGPDGRILYVNQTGCKQLGYSYDELTHMKISDLDPDYPVEKWPEYWQQFRDKKTMRFETNHLTKSGVSFPVEIFANHLVFGGKEFIISFSRDMTEHKKIEAELLESREYLNALINTIADPIFVKDRQHRFVLVNDAFCQLADKAREEYIGKTDYDFFPKKQVDVFLQYDEKVFDSGKPSMNEEIISGADGHVRSILTRKSLYVDKAGNKFIVGVMRDISYLKDLEQKERLALLGRLVADMAHEVSNPLMIISGNAQLSLMEDIGNGKVKENLDIIMSESQRAKEILQRLLKFSRPSKGEQKEIDINRIVEAASVIVEHQFSLSNVTINKALGQGLPVVKIDEHQMHEVLMNLFNNAKDAMPGGGTIEIRTSYDRGKVEIDVKDSGSGMTEEVRSKIFEPFFTTKEKGTGLGLAICHSLIRAHKGEIKVESQVGKGTVFSIILPGG